jgi:hypothetical protein
MEERLPYLAPPRLLAFSFRFFFIYPTMPVATVNKDSSLRFSYEDSGPLDGLYTTLVMVHGTGFHSGEPARRPY